jgi:hypothetical protein
VRTPPIGIVILRFFDFRLFAGTRKVCRFMMFGNERRLRGFATRSIFAESVPITTGGVFDGFGLFDFATVVRPFVRRYPSPEEKVPTLRVAPIVFVGACGMVSPKLSGCLG